MSPDRYHKIARFPERSTRRIKPVKGHKPSVRLELKSYLIIIAGYVSLNCLLVKCASTLLMIIVTFVRSKLMRFRLNFFYYFGLFLFFTAQKWGVGGGAKASPAPPPARSLNFDDIVRIWPQFLVLHGQQKKKKERKNRFTF